MNLVRLDLGFVLAIEVIALMESLKMRSLPWLDVSENDIASSMAKVSALNMLEGWISL